MATAILIHNPTAGNGDHEKKRLLKQISSFGFEVKYYSTQIPGWETFVKKDAEKIFVAGGDGTVQKLARELLRADERMRRLPIQILPLGTANNIATTLGIKNNSQNFENHEQIVKFDMGQVKGLGEAHFFIEAIGAGIFPKLVKVMETIEEEEGVPEDSEEEMRKSLQELIKIIQNYEATEAILIADGKEITGRYLLVEIMNIRYIGPHLELAPNAKTGDGEFELVAVPEEGRGALLTYIKSIINNSYKDLPLEHFAELRKVKEIRFKWLGKDFHIDDEVIDIKGGEIQIRNRQEVFRFCIP